MAKIWTIKKLINATMKAEDKHKMIQLGRGPKKDRIYLACHCTPARLNDNEPETSLCFSFYTVGRDNVRTKHSIISVYALLEQQKALTPSPKLQRKKEKIQEKGLKLISKKGRKSIKKNESAVGRIATETPPLIPQEEE